MTYRFAALGIVGLLIASCNTLTVRETVLSTSQKIATVSNPGDGVTPPTTLVLLENGTGQYVPVSTGFAQAPITAFVAGAGSGIAIGTGLASARPAVTNVSQVQSGSSAQATDGAGGTAQAAGGSANATVGPITNNNPVAVAVGTP